MGTLFDFLRIKPSFLPFLRSARSRVRWMVRLFLLTAVLLTLGLFQASPASQPVQAATDGLSFGEVYGLGALDNTRDVALGDLNGDGALDALVGNTDVGSKVYYNDGTGHLGSPLSLSGSAQSVAIGDLNRDGLLDLVLSRPYAHGQIYLNDGNGGFFSGSVSCSAPPSSVVCFGDTSHNVIQIALGDIDGDSDLDIAAAADNDYDMIFKNNGTGGMDAGTDVGLPSGSHVGIALGDVDGNGQLDIIDAEYWVYSYVLLNNNGFWTGNQPDCAAPPANVRCFGNYKSTFSIALGDLNRDGLLDIALGTGDMPGPGNTGMPDYIFFNNGAGNYPTGTELPNASMIDDTTMVRLGDLNGDGTLDYLASKVGEPSEAILLDANGSYISSQPLGVSSNGQALAVGDLNNDGRLDVVLGNSSSSQDMVLLNTTPHGLMAGTPINANMFAALGDSNKDGALEIISADALGDLNGDTWLDKVVNNTRCLNDQSGAFPSCSAFTANAASAPVLGDLNADQSLDILALNGSIVYQYLNNGSGSYQTGINLFDAASPKTLALGDLNRDGYLDVVIANVLAPHQVLLGNGAGGFTPAASFGDPVQASCLALGDLNSDGALDVVVGAYGEQIRVFFNDGVGSFSAGYPLGEANTTTSLAVGDLNDDGFLDVVTGNASVFDLISNSWQGGENEVYLNDGAGGLSLSFQFGAIDNNGAPENEHSLALGDLDGNGTLDVVDGREGYTYQNPLRAAGGLPDNHPTIRATRPTNTADASFFSAPEVLTGPFIQAPFSLFDPEGNTVGQVRAFFSLDGGANWQPAAGTWPTNYTAGYSAMGSSQTGGPAYQWIEISSTGTQISLSDENVFGPYDIGFQFPFYDRLFSSFWLSDNGWLSFKPPVSQVSWNNVCLPSHGEPTYMVAPFWEDLDPRRGGGIYYQKVDDNTLVIEFNGIYRYSSGGPYTFEVILRRDGTIFFEYASMSAPINGATIGIQNGASSRATQLICNSNYVNTNNAVRIRRGTSHSFFWDVYSSGFFGQSDNVVLRMQAYPQAAAAGNPDTFSFYKMVGNMIQWPYASSVTNPFRARGIQIRVQPNALKFDGSNDYISVPDSTSLDLTSQMTLETWVNLENPQANQKLIGKTPIGSGYLLGVQDGKLYPEVWDSTGAWFGFNAGATIPASTWTHLAVTWQTGGELIGYINGSRAWAVPAGANPIATNATALQIGKAPWGFVFALKGQMGEVRVWNIARSQAAIQMDMYRQLNATEANLVAYWPFEEHSGTTVYDQTANQNNGMLGGGTASYMPVWVTGFPEGSALVYRLAGGQETGAEPMGGFIQPFITNLYGYLSGRGALVNGDKLVALAPVAGDDSYMLYHTSAAPNPIGLDTYTVNTSMGVQPLTVSAANPLLLLNLNISLQWDARADAAFQEQLTYNLQRASQFLYDWTDGQAALGKVTIYHNREMWNDAHIRIYASNHQRPMALQGGIVSGPVIDPDKPAVVYMPGQVHMGAVWSRYGDTGVNLADDWPRALAHELGHWALYLNDNYLGMDPSGQVIPVSSCPSAMSDPYREDYPYDELHSGPNWMAECGSTLSQITVGRSDWETLEAFYPELNGPAINLDTHTGPATLPLAVTQLHWVEPSTPGAALPDPTFYLLQGGSPVQPGSTARAFLYQDGWTIDLGSPRLDRILARGAKPGDRLCVYDPDAGRLGCKTILPQDNQQLTLSVKDWQPQITVSPVNTTTLNVLVSGIVLSSAQSLQARLYPLTGPYLDEISLIWDGSAYTGSFTSPDPDVPILEGYLQLWVNEAEPRREAIVDFAVGGNPARMRGDGARMRGDGARMRGDGAPLMAANGGVILFLDETQLTAHDLFTLQAASSLPYAPSWTTPVGAAYRLSASGNTAPLAQATLVFNYLSSEVPPGEEGWLNIYYLAPSATSWQFLPTVLETSENLASAKVVGQGLYALMSSVPVSLGDVGWNLFAYPVNATRALPEAVASIAGKYTSIYGYEGSDLADPWKLFSPDVPDWVNELHQLEFGRGYWIYATEPITLFLQGANAAAPGSPEGLGGYPPTTFYGMVLAGSGFSPEVGQSVTAWVNGQLCGQGVTRLEGGQVVYVVDVLADGWGVGAGCGEPGDVVRFQVDGLPTKAAPAWDNSHAWQVDLEVARQLFLPLVQR